MQVTHHEPPTPAGVSRLVAAWLVGYAAGLVPSAQLASRMASGDRIDLHTAGSGNPGAANAAAQLGAGWGSFVLGLDLAKGAVAAMAGRNLAGDGGAYVAGAASIAGHVFPVTNRFRGGKGVATSAGASLVLFPAYFPIDAAVVALAASGTGDADRAIRISCAAWTGAALLWWRRGLPNAWGPLPRVGLPFFAVTGSAVMLAKLALPRRPPGRSLSTSQPPTVGSGPTSASV